MRRSAFGNLSGLGLDPYWHNKRGTEHVRTVNGYVRIYREQLKGKRCSSALTTLSQIWKVYGQATQDREDSGEAGVGGTDPYVATLNFEFMDACARRK